MITVPVIEGKEGWVIREIKDDKSAYVNQGTSTCMFLFPSPNQASHPTLVHNLLPLTTYPSRDHEKVGAFHSVNLATPHPSAGCYR